MARLPGSKDTVKRTRRKLPDEEKKVTVVCTALEYLVELGRKYHLEAN